MDRDLNTQIGPIPESNPIDKWINWARWSGISLVVGLATVTFAGVDPGLLLGWVLGVIVAAMLIVFGGR